MRKHRTKARLEPSRVNSKSCSFMCKCQRAYLEGPASSALLHAVHSCMQLFALNASQLWGLRILGSQAQTQLPLHSFPQWPLRVTGPHKVFTWSLGIPTTHCLASAALWGREDPESSPHDGTASLDGSSPRGTTVAPAFACSFFLGSRKAYAFSFPKLETEPNGVFSWGYFPLFQNRSGFLKISYSAQALAVK